jgi:hypothetical protein
MNDNANRRLYSDFTEGLEKLGVWSPMDDEAACRLMAWLLVFGGGCEAVTQNPVMLAHIHSAQRKLNIFGGNVPDARLSAIMREYYLQIKDFQYPNPQIAMPQWALDIFKRYRILNPYAR